LLVNCHLSNKVANGHDHGRPWFLAARRSRSVTKARGMRARNERTCARKSSGSKRLPKRVFSRQEIASALTLRRCRAALSSSRWYSFSGILLIVRVAILGIQAPRTETSRKHRAEPWYVSNAPAFFASFAFFAPLRETGV